MILLLALGLARASDTWSCVVEAEVVLARAMPGAEPPVLEATVHVARAAGGRCLNSDDHAIKAQVLPGLDPGTVRAGARLLFTVHHSDSASATGVLSHTGWRWVGEAGAAGEPCRLRGEVVKACLELSRPSVQVRPTSPLARVDCPAPGEVVPLMLDDPGSFEAAWAVPGTVVEAVRDDGTRRWAVRAVALDSPAGAE